MKSATITARKRLCNGKMAFRYSKGSMTYTLSDVRYFDKIVFIKSSSIKDQEVEELKEIWKDKELHFIDTI
tara:strand:- start:188 stop:400 length:213 start_codon:yes stop_codon:yes gene_type:complete